MPGHITQEENKFRHKISMQLIYYVEELFEV